MKHGKFCLKLSIVSTSFKFSLLVFASPAVLSQVYVSSSSAAGPRGNEIRQENLRYEDVITLSTAVTQQSGAPANNSETETPDDEVNYNKTETQQPPEDQSGESSTIVVTGSHIRGRIAAGANIDTYTREELDRSGYATVQDFIQTIPQNFQGGGVAEDPANGALAASNQLGGAAINLRGLGGDSTLTLINGRRTPQSGLEGNFTDISLIPQSAIDRIEILTDGASALYGSDAIGGVVNIILKKDYSGAESRVRYGRTTEGQLDEYRLAQTFGVNWNSGNVLISYEHYYRDELTYKEKPFASTADLRSRGGTDLRSTSSNPGNILDPQTFAPAFAIPRNQNGRSLTVERLLAGQTNMIDRAPDATLLPRQKRDSVYFSAEQEISNNINLFADVFFSERRSRSRSEIGETTVVVPEENPFYLNPFGEGPVMVAVSLQPDLGLGRAESRIRSAAATGGIRTDLANWRWETVAVYGQEKSHQRSDILDFLAVDSALADKNPDTALNVFGDGRVNNPETISNIIGESVRKPLSKILNINSIADGNLITIADRQISAAVGADYRREKFRHKSSSNGMPSNTERFSRNVYAIFAELFVPLVAKDDNFKFVHAVDLSLAWRFDKYSDVGNTDNPKVGLRISPTESIAINATYGKSFRAPNLIELTQTDNFYFISNVTDPRSPSGRSQALILSGNDPNVEPETSETWTIGATLRSKIIEGLIIKFSYFNIEFENRIEQAGPPQYLLPIEHLYPGLITREPTQPFLEQFCSEPVFFGNPAECIPGLVDVVIDGRMRNMAASTVRGIDGSINFGHRFQDINLSAGASFTYLIDHTFKQTATSKAFDTLNTLNNPIDFRGRAYASASYGAWSGALTLNYTDSYKNDRSALQKTVSSFTTLDLNANVRFEQNVKLSPDGPFELSVNIVNLFNNDPPFADMTIGYDTSNADPIGRMIALEFTARW